MAYKGVCGDKSIQTPLFLYFCNNSCYNVKIICLKMCNSICILMEDKIETKSYSWNNGLCSVFSYRSRNCFWNI